MSTNEHPIDLTPAGNIQRDRRTGEIVLTIERPERIIARIDREAALHLVVDAQPAPMTRKIYGGATVPSGTAEISQTGKGLRFRLDPEPIDYTTPRQLFQDLVLGRRTTSISLAIIAHRQPDQAQTSIRRWTA